MIYVCIYIYNIYRYIHTRTYINMYTFTARGDNARVISRNRYIKVCSCRRTLSIPSEFAGWIATSGSRSKQPSILRHPLSIISAEKVTATDRIHSSLSPPTERIVKPRIGSTTAACLLLSGEEDTFNISRGKILPVRAGRPATCAYIYYTAVSYVYFSLSPRVRPTFAYPHIPLPPAHVCVYTYNKEMRMHAT